MRCRLTFEAVRENAAEKEVILNVAASDRALAIPFKAVSRTAAVALAIVEAAAPFPTKYV